MLNEDLRALGLTPHESEVYLALTRTGKVPAREIIRETGLHRHLVYQALEVLMGRRLVSRTTKNGVFQFQVTDVEHLRDGIREQELVAARLIESLKEQAQLAEQEIMVYEGEQAIQQFSLKSAAQLKKSECIHVLGSGGKRFEEAMGPRALRSYFQSIEKQRAKIRILMDQRQTYDSSTLMHLQKSAFAEVRILPFELAPAANVVFTNLSVAFLLFAKPYTVIEIRNPHLVEAYRNYFELLWKQNVRIEQGEQALHDAFYGMVDALEPGEEYYILGGNVGQEYERLGRFFDDYHRYRITKGVVANILAQQDVLGRIRERNLTQGDPGEKVSHVKTFNTPFLSPMQINLFKGRAVMVLYKPEPTVLYFDGPEVYQGFKLYFDEIWNRRTETWHGYEGIVQLCETVLQNGQDLYLIAANGEIAKTYTEYYKEFTRRRVQKKIHMKVLAQEGKQHVFRSLPLSQTHYLPTAFAGPMVIWVFGETVAHVLWREPQTIFLMRDASTANYYRQYFEAMKKLAHP